MTQFFYADRDYGNKQRNHSVGQIKRSVFTFCRHMQDILEIRPSNTRPDLYTANISRATMVSFPYSIHFHSLCLSIKYSPRVLVAALVAVLPKCTHALATIDVRQWLSQSSDFPLQLFILRLSFLSSYYLSHPFDIWSFHSCYQVPYLKPVLMVDILCRSYWRILWIRRTIFCTNSYSKNRRGYFPLEYVIVEQKYQS
jgi:hypothetical protein